jgi:hypothetical protein
VLQGPEPSGLCRGVLLNPRSDGLDHQNVGEARDLRRSGSGGPKVLEFYEAFAKQRATLIEADGKDILSVKVTLNEEKEDKRSIIYAVAAS